MIGISKSKSWAFPPVVTAMFSILSFGFFSVGVWFLWRLFIDNATWYNLSHLNLSSIFIAALLLLVYFVHIILWFFAIRDLYYLMYGGYRVQSFFIKFMPLRASLLFQDQIEPEYVAIRRPLKVF